MRAAFPDDRHREPVDSGSENEDFAVDDLSPSPTGETEMKTPRDDWRQRSSDSVEPPGRGSGPARAAQEPKHRPTADRRRRESEASDDDDDDERFRQTTTTTTTTTTKTSGRTRDTSRRDELEIRRHRPRSTGDGTASVTLNVTTCLL